MEDICAARPLGGRFGKVTAAAAHLRVRNRGVKNRSGIERYPAHGTLHIGSVGKPEIKNFFKLKLKPVLSEGVPVPHSFLEQEYFCTGM